MGLEVPLCGADTGHTEVTPHPAGSMQHPLQLQTQWVKASALMGPLSHPYAQQGGWSCRDRCGGRSAKPPLTRTRGHWPCPGHHHEVLPPTTDLRLSVWSHCVCFGIFIFIQPLFVELLSSWALCRVTTSSQNVHQAPSKHLLRCWTWWCPHRGG